MLDLYPILGCLEIKSRITPVEPPKKRQMKVPEKR